MARTRSRRRKAPLHPSTTGTFHPIEVRSSGADCRNHGSVDKGDRAPVDDRYGRQGDNLGNQFVEHLQIGKPNLNGGQPEGISTPIACPHHPQLKIHGKDGSSPRKLSPSRPDYSENAKPPSKPQDYTPYMAARAKELKEEGNRLFQKKEYMNAMHKYELALKLIPPDCPDRAIFHSNRAASLMQMKPVQYEAAVHECNLALEAHPRFPRALLRRARAFEAIGKFKLALEDVELLLEGDVSHPDAVEMARRVRACLENESQEVRQDCTGQQSTSASPGDVKLSVEIAADAKAESREAPSISMPVCEERMEGNTYIEDDDGTVLTPVPCTRPPRRMQMPPKPCPQENDEALLGISLSENSQVTSPADPLDSGNVCSSDPRKMESLKRVIHQDSIQILKMDDEHRNMRPLKFIYDHDIRLAEMPAHCTFGNLRKLVRERFPSSKSILIKYRDAEGDLVTITSTHDLRLAEAAAAVEAASKSVHMRSIDIFSQCQQQESVIGLPIVPSSLDQLRLYVMEVPADQEPYDKEDIVMGKGEGFIVSRDGKGNKCDADCNLALEEEGKSNGIAGFDKWLLDFAQLFKTHLGIDPNGHVDLHEGGMELCEQALEEAVSTEEAHKLFSVAGFKFQEMVAAGFVNWGNVYMCAARKQLPDDDNKDSEMDFCDRMQAAFDWAQAQYALAEQKFFESLRIKPDFCDAMLSLGQKYFESAKLHWSLAIAKQTDLNNWDSSEMLELFQKAEKILQEAAELVEKQEHGTKDIEPRSERKGDVDHTNLAFGQDVALKSQVYLFWGNILYEHSQVAFRLCLPSWKKLLEAAVQNFETAGASSSDVSIALQKHLSNSIVLMDVNEKANHVKGEVIGSIQITQEDNAIDFSDEDDGGDGKHMPRDKNIAMYEDERSNEMEMRNNEDDDSHDRNNVAMDAPIFILKLDAGGKGHCSEE